MAEESIRSFQKNEPNMGSEADTHSVNGSERTRRPSILHPDLVIRNKDEVPDPHELELEEELDGWHGYIEWEKYPERKKKAMEFMKKFEFPNVRAYPSPLFKRARKLIL
jgi:hypothetical protein